jgi:hypothetical protein
MDKAERQEILRDLAIGGFAIRPLKYLDKQPKATYYATDGRSFPNLPADPYSVRHYQRRGLSLTPPQVSKHQTRRVKVKGDKKEVET